MGTHTFTGSMQQRMIEQFVKRVLKSYVTIDVGNKFFIFSTYCCELSILQYMLKPVSFVILLQ